MWGPLATFVVINAAASLLSPFPMTALNGMILLGAMLIFITVNMVMINDRGVESTLPWVLGLSMGLNAVLASTGYFLGVDYFTEGGRGYGGTISANNMALMCIYVLPLMVFWTIYGWTRLQRLLGVGLTFLMIAGLVSTESRGGFVNLVAVAGLLLIQFRHHFHPRYLGLVVGGLSALLFAFVAFVPQDYIQRQASLQLLVEWVSGDGQELAEDAALDRRAAYLQVAIDVFPERPILGSGTDTFQEYWIRSMETRWFDMAKRPAHNTYVEVLVGTGLLGSAAFAVLLWITYRNYRTAETLMRAHGDERGAQLAGAYKIAFLSILIYFFVKSGLDHKYFLLALPLSDAVRRYAENRVRRIARGEAAG
jgi:O-antigen ligase